MTDALLWPTYDAPGDLAAVEEVPLTHRGLPSSTYDLVRRAAAARPDHVALHVMPDAERWREAVAITFAELLDDVHRIANALRARGVGRGDAVTVISPNCAEIIPATLAAQLAGVVAPVNPGLAPEHALELVRLSGSRTVIAAGPELDAVVWSTVNALADAGLVDTVLVVRPTGSTDEPEPLALDGVDVQHLAAVASACRGDAFTGTPPTADGIAALFHTGGTTGLPKLAAHTHRNEVSDAWMLAANGLLDEDSCGFAALPLFHVNALVVTLLTPMYKTQTTVWAGPLGYRDVALYGTIWSIVEHFGINTMSAVPTVYAVLAQCPVDADISSMRFAMVGASALPAGARSDFEKHTGVPLVEGYGLTEATCASVRSFPDDPRPGSVGQRMPYQRVKTVRIDEDGSWVDLPRGEKGVLAISGPTVFAGYVTGHDTGGFVLDSTRNVRDGWLDTGDLAWIDEDDFVHLTGRAKDLIIRGGHNIDPTTVEEVLLSHSAVTDAGVVGEPDQHSGEVPVAFVTVADAAVTGDEMTSWVAGRVAERAAAPRSVTILDALPVTDVGKPYKVALRAQATQRVVSEQLGDVPDVREVTAVIENGVVVAVVTVTTQDAVAAVEDVLARFAISSRVDVVS